MWNISKQIFSYIVMMCLPFIQVLIFFSAIFGYLSDDHHLKLPINSTKQYFMEVSKLVESAMGGSSGAVGGIVCWISNCGNIFICICQQHRERISLLGFISIYMKVNTKKKSWTSRINNIFCHSKAIGFPETSNGYFWVISRTELGHGQRKVFSAFLPRSSSSIFAESKDFRAVL